MKHSYFHDLEGEKLQLHGINLGWINENKVIPVMEKRRKHRKIDNAYIDNLVLSYCKDHQVIQQEKRITFFLGGTLMWGKIFYLICI